MAKLPSIIDLRGDAVQLVRQLEQASQRLRSTTARPVRDRQQTERRRRLLANQTADSALADIQIERILAGNDLTDINYLAIGLQRARSVGRILLRQNARPSGFATGFLIAPNIMITNHHVFSDAETVRDSLLQMNYERDATGQELTPVEFRFDLSVSPIIHKPLDFAIAAVQPMSVDGQPLLQFSWLPLSPEPGKAFVGEYLTIIQHPGGERKQICVRENKLLKYSEHEPWVWYQTDTVGGSSGSPVFNNTWDVVALHHQAIPKLDDKGRVLAKNGRPWVTAMGPDAIHWLANEGIRISRILAYLKQRHAGSSLAKAVLNTSSMPASQSTIAISPHETRSSNSNGVTVTHHPDGRSTILLPLQFDVRLNSHLLTGYTAPNHRATSSASVATDTSAVPHSANTPQAHDSSLESISIDTSNYAERNGYQPNFLGASVRVPLPRVTGTKFGRPMKLKDGTTELRYWNYSVVMNQDRKLAFFSAANIRPAERRGTRNTGGFINDKRVTEVDRGGQLGEGFYGRQSTFESDHRAFNPFDRGHLTRREDLQWGTTEAEAKRSGDDSFHFTNCAPQHYAFNQVNEINGLWNRLETMAVRDLTQSPNLCIINGPVFNAPLSAIEDDQIKGLRLNGPRKPDPVFGGVAIPRMYYKLIAWSEDKKLRCRAFVVTQELLLANDERIREHEEARLTPEEIALYEISVPALEKLTGLKFGLPKSATPALKQTESTEDTFTESKVIRIHDEGDL
jgi:endonuclease G